MQFCIFSQKFNFARENKSDKNFCEKNATISQKILHFFTNEIQKQNFTKNAKFSRNTRSDSNSNLQDPNLHPDQRPQHFIYKNLTLVRHFVQKISNATPSQIFRNAFTYIDYQS